MNAVKSDKSIAAREENEQTTINVNESVEYDKHIFSSQDHSPEDKQLIKRKGGAISSNCSENNAIYEDLSLSLDKSGLDIIVTEIKSSMEDTEGINMVEISPFEVERKEQEVNEKVMKVIKLFTEAINKKDNGIEGPLPTDSCFSKQIMNSIFNAAQKSAYFEDESTADFMKVCQPEHSNLSKMEMVRDIGLPSGGTAVQRYRKSGKNPGKVKKVSPRPKVNKTKVKLRGKCDINETKLYINREAADSSDTQQGAETSKRKIPQPRINISKSLLAKNKQTKGPRINPNVTKPKDSTNEIGSQNKVPVFPKNMKSVSGGKRSKVPLITSKGEYISPYKQQLRKTTRNEHQKEQKEEKEKKVEFHNDIEEEYQEIEVDVKIKVIPVDGEVTEKESSFKKEDKTGVKRSAKKSIEKKASPSSNGSFCMGKEEFKRKTELPKISQANHLRYGKGQEKQHQTAPSMIISKSHLGDNYLSKSTQNLAMGEMSRFGHKSPVKRSLSEVSSNRSHMKTSLWQEERRLSTPSFQKRSSSVTSDNEKCMSQANQHDFSYGHEVENIENYNDLTEFGIANPLVLEADKTDSQILDFLKEAEGGHENDMDNSYQESRDKMGSLMDKDLNSMRQGTAFDSSFMIMNSVSHEINGDDLLNQSYERDKKERFVTGASFTNKNKKIINRNGETHVKPGKTDLPASSKEKKNDSLEKRDKRFKRGIPPSKAKSDDERTRGRRCNSVSDNRDVERRCERKSRSLESRGSTLSSNPIMRDSSPKKATSSKIYHTLPATTGGANLFVESRGVILPYIGHIERLDVEISRSESEIRQNDQFHGESSTPLSMQNDRKQYIGLTDNDDSEPTATVRSSTPNNVNLEVKIPLPTELSSSIDHSDSPTLTFNIDVSLENNEQGDGDCKIGGRKGKRTCNGGNKKGNSRSLQKESKKEKGISEISDVNNKMNFNESPKNRSQKGRECIYFDGTLNHKIGKEDVNIGYENIQENTCTIEVDHQKNLKDTHINLPQNEDMKISELPDTIHSNNLGFPLSNEEINEEISSMYDVISETSTQGRKENVEKTSGRTARRIWPTNNFVIPFENNENGNNLSSSFNDQSPPGQDNNISPHSHSNKKRSEERVCLGGGLVFNVSKKQAMSSRPCKKNHSPRNRSYKQGTSTLTKTEGQKITKSSSMPNRLVSNYTQRCQESTALSKISHFYGGKSSPGKSTYQRTSNSFSHGTRQTRNTSEFTCQSKPKENGLNEEKVNNLVCDIKDAGATISDILDEMQALKMFLNEEDGVVSTNVSTKVCSTNASGISTEFDSSVCSAKDEDKPRGPVIQGLANDTMCPPKDTDADASKTPLVKEETISINERLKDGEDWYNDDSSLNGSAVSFKKKLKEELARSISATLQEIHPYSNRLEEVPMNYSPTNAEKIPSMDDTLRELRISVDDIETEAVITSIPLYNVRYSPDIPTYTHAKDGQNALTYLRSSLEQVPVSTPTDTKKGKDLKANPFSTETKIIPLRSETNEPPPKSYVRPMIFNKTLTGNRILEEEMSLDSGLFNTNSTDDSPSMHPADTSANHSKGTRGSFEQHEISLGIIDESGRFRRNSEIVDERDTEDFVGNSGRNDKTVKIIETTSTATEMPERGGTFIKFNTDTSWNQEIDKGKTAGNFDHSSENIDFDENIAVQRYENLQTSSPNASYIPSTRNACHLSPDVTSYGSTSIGIPYGSFSYEEEIIETYKFIDEPSYRKKSSSSDSTNMATSVSNNVNICYKSSTNYYPIGIENDCRVFEGKQESENDELVVGAPIEHTKGFPNRFRISEHSNDYFEEDSINKTRSHNCTETEETLYPVNIKSHYSNKNCL